MSRNFIYDAINLAESMSERYPAFHVETIQLTERDRHYGRRIAYVNNGPIQVISETRRLGEVLDEILLSK